MNEINQLNNLLPEIKRFLTQNIKIEGASTLLSKLNTYLQLVYQSLKIAQFPKHQQYAQSNSTNFMLQPNQYANILDAYILQYNFQNKDYQILSIHPNPTPTKTQSQTSIKSLIIGPPSSHLKPKQKTSSMTSLHKHISNISKNNPPLVIPYYLGQTNRYTYIYQVQQCVEWQDQYYLVDRYVCFVVDGVVGGSLEELVKSVRGVVFRERVVNAHSPFYVNANYTIASIRSATNSVSQLIANHQLTLDNEPIHHAWLQKQHKYYFKQSNKSLKSSILLFCTYFLINNYKLGFLISKQNKHKLSQLILSLQSAIQPLNIPCSIIFSNFQRNNPQFIQSPIPIVLGYWGTESERRLFGNYCLGLKNGIQVPAIVVDLESNTVVYDAGVQANDVVVVEKLNKHVKRFQIGENLLGKTSEFIQDNLEKMAANNGKVEKSQWRAVFHQKIKNSQTYNKIK